MWGLILLGCTAAFALLAWRERRDFNDRLEDLEEEADDRREVDRL